MKFWKKGKEKKEEKSAGANQTFLEFLTNARREMEVLMAQDPEWFYHLPYKGAMSREAAKDLEIEKRAIWRRIIYDAKRTKLAGLRWETRSDDLVCPECRNLENRIFSIDEYD
ncbi:MAG: hypothetical protein C0407_13320, partial [Desulfobacca sp.]|nr:hypothetical protein [Desulfobacca sp.]